MDSLQITYYTADSLAFIAKDAAERSADAASLWDPLVAVVFSAIMIEAAVNEILETVASDRGPLPESVRRLKEFSRSIGLAERRTSLSAKIQTIATILSGAPLKRNEHPSRDFDLLIAARNFLVHHRPERASRATDSSEWQVSKAYPTSEKSRIQERPSRDRRSFGCRVAQARGGCAVGLCYCRGHDSNDSRAVSQGVPYFSSPRSFVGDQIKYLTIMRRPAVRSARRRVQSNERCS